MKPIKFNEANKNLLKPQNMTDEECSSLWVFTDGQQCISCWKMSFKQRLSALIHGKVCYLFVADKLNRLYGLIVATQYSTTQPRKAVGRSEKELANKT